MVMKVQSEQSFGIAKAFGEITGGRVEEQLRRGKRAGTEDHRRAMDLLLRACDTVHIGHCLDSPRCPVPLQLRCMGAEQQSEMREALEQRHDASCRVERGAAPCNRPGL